MIQAALYSTFEYSSHATAKMMCAMMMCCMNPSGALRAA